MLKILLVEDCEHDIAAVKRILRKYDKTIELYAYSHAKMALEKLEQGVSFDFMIVDQGLPDIKGVELCKKVIEKKLSLPMIILTGEGSQDLAVEALKAGVDDYMVKDIHGHYLGVLPLVLQDVLQRHEDKRARAEIEEKFMTLFNNAPIGIFRSTFSGKLIDVNPAIVDMFGFESQQAMIDSLCTIDMYSEPESRQPLLDGLTKQGRVNNLECQLKVRNGQTIWVAISARLSSKQCSEDTCMEGFILDITEKKQQEERIKQLAMHDNLTGLPNRNLFEDRLSHAITMSDRSGVPMAILYLDLDGFKEVNDSSGHAAGDAVLVEISHRLKHCLREEDTIARLGGDEFCVILPHTQSREQITNVADKILDNVRQEIIFNNKPFYLGASIGISIYPEDAESGSELLKVADRAMYSAKNAGKQNYRFAYNASDT